MFQELGIDKNAFDRLPRQLQVACWRGEGGIVCIASTCSCAGEVRGGEAY